MKNRLREHSLKRVQRTVCLHVVTVVATFIYLILMIVAPELGAYWTVCMAVFQLFCALIKLHFLVQNDEEGDE